MTGAWSPRAVLDERRAEVTAQIEALSRELAGIMDSALLTATDDEHDPEGATLAFERAQCAALLSQARDHRAELDHALRRLADGSYGRCERCRQPIGTPRLTARPAARTCLACTR
ncbi:MAG TPA: TraR/DksA family transcriptional regulator [Mycobacteriales bacterium]|nr:TraR/DksA family transcriptional regulator [Mycobacteriales bacterium]